MWLPPEDEITVDTNLQDGCYDHPVVIISPQPSGGEVVILMMTSLNETDLLEKYPRNTALRRKHLPIYPSNRHPDLDILLSLEGDQNLKKNSYIRTDRQHSIEFAALRPYRGPRIEVNYVLTTESYQQVIKHAGFHAPIPSPVATTIQPNLSPPLNAPQQRHQGIDISGLILPRITADERLNLHGAAPRYGTMTIPPTRQYPQQTASPQTLYSAGERRHQESSRSSTLLLLHHNPPPGVANHHVPRYNSRDPARGWNPPSSPRIQLLLLLALFLAFGAGAALACTRRGSIVLHWARDHILSW